MSESRPPTEQEYEDSDQHQWDLDKAAEDHRREVEEVEAAPSRPPDDTPRRWRCPDCGLPNQWEALECLRCHVISPPDKDQWKVEGFVRSPIEQFAPVAHDAKLVVFCSKDEAVYLQHAAGLRGLSVSEYVKQAINASLLREGVDAVLFRVSADGPAY
jgi:hypothetical protein